MLRLFVALATLSGCLGLHPIRGEARIIEARGKGGAASVELLAIHAQKLVMLRVMNRGPGVLTINRHNFLLKRPADNVYMEPVEGWGGQTYHVNPGEDHEVNLKYNLDNVRKGDELELVVDEALFANGQALTDAQPIRILADY